MTLYHSTGIIAASGGAAAKPGMVLLKPTSVDHSGTSASIGANGQVTFTAVTSLSLNGVFSATYDNYLIVMRSLIASGANVFVRYRLRTSGTDASGSNYTVQYLEGYGTTVNAARLTSQTSGGFTTSSVDARSGHSMAVYGPALAQPTASRSVNVNGLENATLWDGASTHSLSTSYDGITLFPESSSISGALQVYGVRG